ncbi:MAG: preprotein translocase subunit YajC [Lachnospiraceae bacterium]|nr:preprotein translocase subunit YajC [Lachnospiraceae bacterium]
MVLFAEAAGAGGALGGSYFIVLIGMLVVMYFIMIVPQRKEQKKKAQLLAAMAIGDSVRTASGMIGTIIDISDNMVIVEFGNNKNCRIPMIKEAITEVEKPQDAVAKTTSTAATEEKQEKKFKLFGK